MVLSFFPTSKKVTDPPCHNPLTNGQIKPLLTDNPGRYGDKPYETCSKIMDKKSNRHLEPLPSHTPLPEHSCGATIGLKTVYHQLPNDQWQLYRLSIRRGRQPSNNVYFWTPTLLNSVPMSITPAPVIHLSPHRAQMHGECHTTTQPPCPPVSSFKSYIQNNSSTWAWALTNLNGLDNMDHIKDSI